MAGYHGGAAPVFFQHRGNHAVALVPGEIDVDIRGIGPAGMQKPLEIQIMPDRAHVGDPQAVGHQGGSTRTAAAGAGALGHDIGHDQEVPAKPLLRNHGQFMLQPVDHGFGQLAVTTTRAFIGRFPQAHGRLFRSVLFPGRHYDPEIRSFESDLIGCGHRIADRLRADIKSTRIIRRAPQKGIPRRCISG